ncbi:hypothetical protein [Sinorhizobium meliloti]|uniref:hypothetical protein n=1 Tax=Rhizobium meliloti TaxID=382 RepID=UPI000FD78415|nr:hypothetical protein [Sinorhizobium meliloti]RVL37971.1 hypothetical protein CN148_11655 [Sinorhizobium meliloti]
MIAILASPLARYLLGASAALFALWLVYNVIDNRGYQRAATEYTLKIERIHAEYKDVADKEAARQRLANDLAKQREAQRIAKMQAENKSLHEQIEELEREASQDPDAGKPVLGAPSVQRINKVR